MDEIKIIPCRPGDQFFHRLGEVKAALYPESLLSQKHEDIDLNYLITCLLAFKNGNPQGMLCLYHNPFISHQGEKTFLIGNFECTNDIKLAQCLIGEAKKIAKRESACWIIGPLNGSTWNDYRFSLSRNLPFFFTESIQHGYYADLFIESGFNIIYRYLTNLSPIKELAVDAGLAFSLVQEGVSIRKINMDIFDQELGQIHALSSEVFTGNPLFSPISLDAFIQKYRRIAAFIDPRFVLLAEKEGQLLGVLFSIPDRFASHKTLIIKTIARSSQAPPGLMQLLVQTLYSDAYLQGYSSMIHAYMFEGNRSVRLSEKFGGRPFKEHALFILQCTT